MAQWNKSNSPAKHSQPTLTRLAWKHPGPYLSSLFKFSPIVEPKFLIPASRAVYAFWYLAMCSSTSTSQERLCEYFCLYYNRLKGYKKKFLKKKENMNHSPFVLAFSFELQFVCRVASNFFSPDATQIHDHIKFLIQ